ncbi:MAG: type II secretion system F family protein [Nanoarchaeota archaeon]
MEIKKFHVFGIVFALVVVVLSFFFAETDAFFFLIGIGIVIGITPFVSTIIYEAKIDNEKEEMFLEFSRDLVESVKTGTPISKSIVNMKNKPYGVMTPHIRKLANQISMGIPLSQALVVLSKDVETRSISRVLTLIGQAEKAGGDIGQILESVAGAVSLSDKLKKERKSTISSLVVQGYIIFLVFLIIILVMEFRILPMLSGITNLKTISTSGVPLGSPTGVGDFSSAFLYLILIQGFFSGLAVGKLSEGSLKAGIKHSFALMVGAFLISTGAGLIFGGSAPA